MERLILPLPRTTTAQDVLLLEWHVEEGTALRRHCPLVTVQVGTHRRQYFFAGKQRACVIQAVVNRAGERLAADATLALVGMPGERLPEGRDIKTLPPLGTEACLRKSWACLRMLLCTILCPGLLLALHFLTGEALAIEGNAGAGTLPALHLALAVLLSIATNCLCVPMCIGVSLFLLLLPLRSQRVLTSRRLPEVQPPPAP